MHLSLLLLLLQKKKKTQAPKRQFKWCILHDSSSWLTGSLFYLRLLLLASTRYPFLLITPPPHWTHMHTTYYCEHVLYCFVGHTIEDKSKSRIHILKTQKQTCSPLHYCVLCLYVWPLSSACIFRRDTGATRSDNDNCTLILAIGRCHD